MADEPKEMSEDEKLAAEWAAMAGDDQSGGGEAGGEQAAPGLGDATTTRVLNQDEIDSLLGFDEGGAGEGDTSGIQAIVNSALV